MSNFFDLKSRWGFEALMWLVTPSTHYTLRKFVLDRAVLQHVLYIPLDPIDLTGEGDQDLQKALALSLQVMKTHSESAAISLEEQELSR